MSERPSAFPPALDHLVLAGPDLEEAVEHAAALLGVRPAPGGAHPQWGTRNALLALGPRAYLEVIGPDPANAGPPPALFGIDRLAGPRLVTWAAHPAGLGAGLGAGLKRARDLGLDLGAIAEGSRRRPDGVDLRWRLTDPFAAREEGVVPFFIDWGDSPHPSESAPRGAELVGLRAEHPRPERVAGILRGLEVGIEVAGGPEAVLIARIRTAAGAVELR